jgi:hypothetical protein
LRRLSDREKLQPSNGFLGPGLRIMSIVGSERSYIGREVADGPPRTLLTEMPVQIVSQAKKAKQQTPQAAIDEFWSKFTTKTPGKGVLKAPVSFPGCSVEANVKETPLTSDPSHTP